MFVFWLIKIISVLNKTKQNKRVITNTRLGGNLEQFRVGKYSVEKPCCAHFTKFWDPLMEFMVFMRY